MNRSDAVRFMRPVFAALLVAPLVASAAPPTEEVFEFHAPPAGFGHGEGLMPWGGPGGRGIGPLELMGPMHRLDLTDAQEDAAFGLMHAQGERMYQLRKKIERTGEALRELGRKEGFDAGKARALADEIGRATADLALLRAELQAKFRALLTPEQRAKLDKMGPMRIEMRKQIRELRDSK